MMPGMTGIELYHLIRREHPGLEDRMVFMTGAVGMQGVSEFLESVNNPKFEKPFDLPQFRRTAARAGRSGGAARSSRAVTISRVASARARHRPFARGPQIPGRTRFARPPCAGRDERERPEGSGPEGRGVHAQSRYSIRSRAAPAFAGVAHHRLSGPSQG